MVSDKKKQKLEQARRRVRDMNGYIPMQMPNHITNSEGVKATNAIFQFHKRKAELITKRKWWFDKDWNLTDGTHQIDLLIPRTFDEINKELKAYG